MHDLVSILAALTGQKGSTDLAALQRHPTANSNTQKTLTENGELYRAYKW